MSIEQQRKAFEEAFKKEHSGVSFWLNTWDEEEQSYGHLTAGWAWKMWLAAQQQKGYVMVPVEPIDEIDLMICKMVDHRIDCFEADRIYRAIIEESQK